LSPKDHSVFTHLLTKYTFWSDHVLEHVTCHVDVDGTEWVVEEVDVGVLVHGPRQTHSQLLTSAQTDALQDRKKAVWGRSRQEGNRLMPVRAGGKL